MAKVNLVEKQVKMELGSIIKFQLATHCHLNRIQVSEADLNCLSVLGVVDKIDLSEFCTLVAAKKIFKTTQTVRNSLVRMEKHGIIVKSGPSKKREIELNPSLNIQTEGNILLMYKVVHVNDTNQVQGAVQ